MFPSYFFKIGFSITLPCMLSFSGCLFPSGFPTKIPQISLSLLALKIVTCTAHLIILCLITWVIYEKHKSLCNLFQPPLPLSKLGFQFVKKLLFSNQFSIEHSNFRGNDAMSIGNWILAFQSNLMSTFSNIRISNNVTPLSPRTAVPILLSLSKCSVLFGHSNPWSWGTMSLQNIMVWFLIVVVSYPRRT